MKLIKMLSVFLLVLLFANYTYSQQWKDNLPKGKSEQQLTLFDYQKAFDDYWSAKDVKSGYYYQNGVKTKAIGWKQFKRWEYMMEGQVNPVTGEFPKTTAEEQFNLYYKNNPEVKSTNGNWIVLGPSSNTSGYAGTGRVNCVAFHPTDNNTYWVGTPAGGIWVTTNNGTSWTCLSNNNAVIGISDIVIPTDYATSNTIYIATGDKDGWDNNSVGVLKSTNGGTTWLATGLSFTTAAGKMVSRLLLSPTDNNTLIAATSDGVYKTTNGGTTWSTQLTTTDFIDMEYKPGDFNTLYGSTSSGAIYTSTNGGTSWTQTLNLSAGRIELAVSANQTTYVYALVAANDNGLYGVYKSTTSGNNGSFTQIFNGTSVNLMGWNSNGGDLNTGQGWYDLSLAVSPSNANTLLVGGVNTWKSINGGTSWTIANHWIGSSAQEVHADKHSLRYRSNGDLFECNDGGLYVSSNNGTLWTDKTSNLIISQIYKLSTSKTVQNEVIIGLQDNGTKLISGGTWSDVKGGDGMECLIDYSNVDIQYGTYTNGQIDRTINHWTSTTDISANITGDNTGAWVTPYIIDPSSATTLYAGYSDVWKTTNRGDSWTKISTMNTSDKIRSMAIAPSNSSYLYVADRTTIWKTINGGTAWTNITGTLPVADGNIRYIAVKTNDPLTVWVTISGYTNPGVYQTTNGGTSWTNISTGLPTIPCNTIVQNKLNTTTDELYVGTDFGVYFKNGSNNWVLFNTGLPNVVIGELEIWYGATTATSKLRAATYGRGLWESDMYYNSVTQTFTSCTTTQNVTTTVAPNQINQQIIGVEIVMNGSLTPLNVTSFTFNTTGSTNAGTDITNAKLYYTAGNNIFSASTQFGTVSNSPNGTFTITGTQTLGGGTNYFWLTYDVPATATIGDLLDAQCTSLTVGTAKIPTTTNPSGSRQIAISYCAAGSPDTQYEYINNFAIGTINQASIRGTNGYEDKTSVSTNLNINIATNFIVQVTGSYASDQILIWGDLNKDGDFLDANETLYTSSGAGFSSPHTASITIPSGTATGTTRLRIRLHDTSTGGNATPCGDASYGEVEDYTINLTPANIPPIANFSANNTYPIVGETVTFSDLSTYTPTSWAWSFNPTSVTYTGGTSATSQNPQVQFNAETAYNVTLIATNSFGSDSEIKTAYINPAFYIGTTRYDLQSNYSVASRLFKRADGTMSATWTYGIDNVNSFPDRGTGYNYFDATNWGTAPTARLENVRTGWPNNGILANGKEFVISHGTNKWNNITRTTAGTGTWSDISIPPSAFAYISWPRTAVSGNTIHCIGLDTGTGSPTLYNLFYWRSTDGGTTWDKTDVNIEPTGSSTKKIGGDNYAIDVAGNTVAIVVFGQFNDIALFKSTDGGNTFTKTLIMDFPVDNFDLSTSALLDIDANGTADQIMTCDKAGALVIDNNGLVHVFFGKYQVSDGAAADGQYSYAPTTDGLMYWNETMGAGTFNGSVTATDYIDLFDGNSCKAQQIASMEDVDANGTIDLQTSTQYPFGIYFHSLTSYPSAGVDADNNIYLSYSSVNEANYKITATPNVQHFRNLYVMKSINVGKSWGKPLNTSTGILATQENVFASVAKNVGTNFEMIWQYDDEPGISVQGDQDAYRTNYIGYQAIPVANIPTAPIAITNAATNITSTATLNGTINAYNSTTTVTFEYGLTTDYGTSVDATPNTVSGNTNTAVSYNLTGLTSNTTYHFRVKAVSANGTTYGDDITFNSAQLYTVSTSVNPTLAGTTIGDGNYTVNENVTVVATPETGYTFVNWTINGVEVSTNSSYTFVVNSNVELVANFALINYNISLTTNLINSGTLIGDGSYAYNSNATVIATANTGYTFVNWTLNGVIISTNASYTFTVTESQNLVANFSINNYNLTVAANPTIGGITTGTGTYVYNSIAIVTAIANNGYTFVNWTDGADIVSSNATYSFAVTKNTNLIANFQDIPKYDLEIAVNGTGTTTPSTGTYQYYKGEIVDLYASPALGFTFSKWVIDNVEYLTPSVQITINSYVLATAYFSPTSVPQYFVNISSIGNGTTIPPTGTHIFNEGETVNLSAIPDAGNKFLAWTENSTIVSTNANYSFTINSNHNLIANFLAIPQRNLTIVYAGTGGTSTPAAGTYQYNENQIVDLYANADFGYQFDKWIVEGTQYLTPDIQVTMNQNVTATVYFVPTTANQFSLDVLIEGNGTTTPPLGNHIFNEGTKVDLIATPDFGYEFSKWIIDDTEYNTLDVQITMNKNIKATAYFIVSTVVQNKVNIFVNGNGTTTPTIGNYLYNQGSSVTLLATANTGNKFDKWIVNTQEYLTSEIQLIINQDVTATAYFSVIGNVTKIANNNINIYPNPTNGIFNIELIGFNTNDIEVIVTDLTGRTILKSNKHIIDLTNTAAGVYIINITIDKQTFNSQLIKY